MALLQRKLSEPSKLKSLGAQAQVNNTPAAPISPAVPMVEAEAESDNLSFNKEAYQIPAKKRTSAKIAGLRKQLRAKLLSSENEADGWQRGDAEKENILIGRMKAILQKGNAHG